MTELRMGKTGSRAINELVAGAGAAAVASAIADLTPATGTPVNAVAAQGTLTIAEPVTAENTMTIGAVVYTFKANGTAAAAGEIDMGAAEADTKLNIVKAIKGTDTLNDAHPTVDCAAAFVGDNLVLTAKTKGAAGNAIVTTQTLTHESNIFDADTLGTTTAGVNGTVGSAKDQKIDNSYLYVAIADNTVSDTNWRRISLGNAY